MIVHQVGKLCELTVATRTAGAQGDILPFVFFGTELKLEHNLR